MAVQAAAVGPASHEALPQLQWSKLPPGWQEHQPMGAGLAAFSLPGNDGQGGELSVMSFPGEGASKLDLINIVRQNSGLPPLKDEELSKLVEPVMVGSDKATLIDFTSATSTGTNAPPGRIMLTVLPHDGVTWFFKLSGDSSVVAAQKPALLDFLKSVSFTKGADGAGQGRHFTSTNDKQTPDSAAPAPTIPKASNGVLPAWEVPANWKEVPPSEMLLAKFAINNTDGSADLTVSSFPGDVGGTLANVNRWRGQLGLAPVAEGELDKLITQLDVLGGKAMLVDMNGQNPRTAKPARMIGVIWPRNGQTWFYKMLGDPAAIGREKDAFVKFVQSVRYPNG
ncbi:MAG: hypothetical protein JWR26_1213 [Pedosphaera sp.]|nr:hypothetical protein [Pedosphaera sp.]